MALGFLVRQVVFAADDDDVAAVQLDAGPSTGVWCDPGPVGLWNLEAILSNRSFAEVLAEQKEPVAMFNDGQRLVFALSTRLRDDLALLKGWRAHRVVRRWARSDEVRAERLAPTAVSRLMFELHELARDSVKAQRGLYLWVDVDERALF